MRFSSWAAASLVIAFLSAPPAGAADDRALGRRHARKAQDLANRGNCKAALAEFAKAYSLLKDGVILFNRAECHRKTGDGAGAIADYRQFLVEVPEAPNRRQVEARIAELEASLAPRTDLPKPPAAAAALPPPRPEPNVAGPPAAEPPAGPPPPTPAHEPALAPVPAPVVDLSNDLDTASADRSESPPSRPITHRWWFWTTLGVLALAGGAAGWLVMDSRKTEVPSSALGNYKF